MLTYVMIGLGLWNLIVAAIYGLDKFFAVKEKQRISEFSLLFFAFCFAGLGALLGMVLCQHKTRKWKFRHFLWAMPIFTSPKGLFVWDMCEGKS